MKQKNLILIAVAVVCGLVAAVLTSRLSAGGSKAKTEDLVEIPVAAKDIPIGSKIAAKDVEQLFVKKKFPKDAVPPAYIADTQEMVDKRTMRPIRQGETINPADISATGFLAPPDGHVLMTAPISLERGASGFALPGARVMVIASKKSNKKNLDIVFPIFVDTLILAVDTNPSAPQANQNGQNGQNGQGGSSSTNGFQQMSMISFAVTPEDSVLLSMAADGATLRLALPDQDEKKKEEVVEHYKKMIPTREAMERIFADNWDHEKTPKSDENAGPRYEIVKVKVPTETIESGTEITEEILAKKFKEIEFPKEFVLTGAAADDKDLIEKFASADLAPGLIAPKAHLSKTKPIKPNTVVTKDTFAAAKTEVPESEVTYPKGETDNTPQAIKREYTYVTVHTASGKVIHKYEVLAGGKTKYVGVVTPGLDD
jgi:pilus assembly protein CpaB